MPKSPSIPQYYYNLQVLICDKNGTPAGSGICIDGKHIITCAHVVNEALNKPNQRHPTKPGEDETVKVIFLYNENMQSNSLLQANVIAWGWSEELLKDPLPFNSDLPLISNDIAVLHIPLQDKFTAEKQKKLQNDCKRLTFLDGNLNGHPYVARVLDVKDAGYPSFIEGEIGHTDLASGITQLDPDDNERKFFFDSGSSGSPVLCLGSSVGIAGYVVYLNEEKKPEDKLKARPKAVAALMINTASIERLLSIHYPSLQLQVKEPYFGPNINDFHSVTFQRAGNKNELFTIDKVARQIIDDKKQGIYWLITHFPKDAAESMMAFYSLLSLSNPTINFFSPKKTEDLIGFFSDNEAEKIDDYYLIDLSNISIETVLSRSQDILIDIANAIASYITAQQSLKIVFAFPHYFLHNSSFSQLTKKWNQNIFKAPLLSAGNTDSRLERIQSRIFDDFMRTAIIRICSLNSSSLVRAIQEYVESGAGENTSDGIGELLKLATFLLNQGFIEPAYRLELFCRTQNISDKKVQLAADVQFVSFSEEGVKDPIVAVAAPVQTLPEFSRRIILEGEQGSGISTSLRLLEAQWALPFWNNERSFRSFCIPFYFTAQDIEQTQAEVLFKTYFLRKIMFSTPEDSITQVKLEAHDWLSRYGETTNLPFIFSSPVFVSIDKIPTPATQAIQNLLTTLHRSDVNMGLAVSWKSSIDRLPKEAWFNEVFARAHKVSIRKLNDNNLSEIVALNSTKINLLKILGTIDRPISRNITNPFLVNLVLSITASESELMQMNTFQLLTSYIDSKLNDHSNDFELEVKYEQLPEYAFACKTKSIFSLNEQAAACGVACSILGNDHRFINQTFEDFFAALYILQRIESADSFHNEFASIFRPKKAFVQVWKQRWKNVFLLMSGSLKKDLNKTLVELLAENDPGLAHECLWESMTEISKEELAALPSTQKLLAQLISPSAGEINVTASVEAVAALGALDPRIWQKEPGANMIAINDSNIRMGKYPVTNLEYLAFIKDRAYDEPREEIWGDHGMEWLSKTKNKYPLFWHNNKLNRPNFPVVGVSLHEARAYCKWLSQNIETDHFFRMPYISEWDKSSAIVDSSLLETIKRNLQNGSPISGNGDFKAFFSNKLYLQFTEIIEQLPEFKVFCADKKPSVPYRPVGIFPPNSGGFHDMLGYIWQWCEDEPGIPTYENARVIGGPCRSINQAIWALVGGQFDIGTRFHEIGFRIILEKK